MRVGYLVRALSPEDTWQRHSIVARLCQGMNNVLDAGGVSGGLAAFMPGASVIAANVDNTGDIRYDGRRLPLADNSFDAATSLDVLEHVERSHRRQHLSELVRVARQLVILCTPLGTPDHVEAERHLAEWFLATTGSRHRFLEEHLGRGLATVEELRDLAGTTSFAFTLWFSRRFPCGQSHVSTQRACEAPTAPGRHDCLRARAGSAQGLATRAA